jgi:hypothetical protein
MAADRQNGFQKHAVIRERIDRFSRNLTNGAKQYTFSEGFLKICIIGHPRWQPTAILDFGERM